MTNFSDEELKKIEILLEKTRTDVLLSTYIWGKSFLKNLVEFDVLKEITLDIQYNTSEFLPKIFIDTTSLEMLQEFQDYLKKTTAYLYEKYDSLREIQDFEKKFIEHIIKNSSLKCAINYKLLEERLL